MAKNSEAARPARWTDSDKPERIIGFLLRALHLTLRQSIDEALRQQGVEISFAQFAALVGLRLKPGAAGAELARQALVSAQTMNAALRKLEAEALVERHPHPQSRKADSWQITDAGLRQLQEAGTVGDSVFERMLAALAPEEVAQLQSLLSRCIVGLGAEDKIPDRILAAYVRRPAAGRRAGP